MKFEEWVAMADNNVESDRHSLIVAILQDWRTEREAVRANVELLFKTIEKQHMLSQVQKAIIQHFQEQLKRYFALMDDPFKAFNEPAHTTELTTVTDELKRLVNINGQ